MILLVVAVLHAVHTMAVAAPEFDSELAFQLICRLIPNFPGCQSNYNNNLLIQVVKPESFMHLKNSNSENVNSN